LPPLNVPREMLIIAMMPLLLRSGCSFLVTTQVDRLKEITIGIETGKRDLSQEISALLRA